MAKLTDISCPKGHLLEESGYYRVAGTERVNCKPCHKASVLATATTRRALSDDVHQMVTERERSRFWAKVEVVESGCWEWTAALQSTGYGSFAIASTQRLAHRVAYTAIVGPIPEGAELDHLCRNRKCVNPEHLEAVSHLVNMQRAQPWRKLNSHCVNGHEFTSSSTRIGKSRGTDVRVCLICQRENRRKRSALIGSVPATDKTHCTHGHEYTPENTTMNAGGSRRCRACYKAGYARRKAQSREAHPA